MGTLVMLPARGRALTMDGRQVFRLYPRGYGRSGRDGFWLYAVGLANGITKVGMTRAPRRRMVQHWASAEGAISWTHLFRSFDGHRKAGVVERAAVALLAEVGKRIRLTETFRGLSRDDAVRCVRQAIEEQGG